MDESDGWTSKTLFIHFTALREADLRALEAALAALKTVNSTKQNTVMGALALIAALIAGAALFVK
jgi:hypothetical protein